MGLSDKFLLQLAKKLFGDAITKFTDLKPEQQAAVKEAYEAGKKDGSKGSENESENTPTPVNTAKTSAGFSTSGPLVDIINSGAELERAFSKEGIGESIDELISGAQQLSSNMGIGRARAGEFRAMIADTVPEMQKLGFDQQKTLAIMEEIPKTLGVNTTLTKETIVEIGSAAKFSGVGAGTLANNFKSVGMNLSDVGNKMAEAANYAKSVGVNVEAVTSKLASSLKNLNLFNFDGGVKGMAKMVAQSEMLGGIMDSVMQKAEGLLDPEKAIEFSAALQRLGVQSSALLDPLSAMDMALNDPAALQNEMVKVSQQFTRLKADGSGFEILPGAKLQLREVAEKLGMTADEFAKMSIKSADLEMKMSKIRFPGFAASEEDKMLIANMAQMKDGRAMVTIAKEGGGTDEVAVEDLTAQQLEELKKDQANQNKTAEEIALDQLSVLEEISNSVKGTAKGISMGIASTGAVQRVTNLSNELRRTVTSVVAKRATTEGMRGTVSPILGGLEKGVIKGITEGDPMVFLNSISDITESLKTTAEKFSVGSIDAVQELIKSGSAKISEQYGGISGVKAGESQFEKTLMNLLDLAKSNVSPQSAETSKTSNFNITQKIEFQGDASKITENMIETTFNNLLLKLKQNPDEMNKLSVAMDKSMSGSGMGK